MSVRYVIRKFSDTGYHQWSLRDGLCREMEHHDFHTDDWSDTCTGACDTFKFFSSAIRTASEAK